MILLFKNKYSMWYTNVGFLLAFCCLVAMIVLPRNSIGGLYADSVTIPNDGLEKATPYGDSKLPSSYGEGSDYYDCFIPYGMTTGEIGGCANGYSKAKPQFSYSMEQYPERKNYKISAAVTREGKASAKHNCTISSDDIGMNIATDSGGNQYYICAIPGFCFAFGGTGISGGSNFPQFTSTGNGQAIDIVLTDSTCLHFVVFDHKALTHTNGGPASDNSDVVYTYGGLNKAQYKNLFQAANGDTLEIFSDNNEAVKKFKERFGIGTSNYISVIRMYNIDLDNGAPTRAAGVGTTPYYKMADSVSVTGSGSGGGSGSGSTVVGGGSKLVSEWELAGMPNNVKLSDEQSEVILLDRSSLSVKESDNVAKIGEDIAYMSEIALLDRVRAGISFLGIIVLLYGVFLVCAVLFDRANNFLDISLVHMLTFGKIYYDPWSEDMDKQGKNFAGTKKVIISAVIVIIVGMLILSGSLTVFMGKVVYRVMKGIM